MRKIIYILLSLISIESFSQSKGILPNDYSENYFEKAISLSKEFAANNLMHTEEVEDSLFVESFQVDSLIGLNFYEAFFLQTKIGDVLFDFTVRIVDSNIIFLRCHEFEMSNGIIMIHNFEKKNIAYYLEYSDYFNKSSENSRYYDNIKYIMRLDSRLFPIDKMKINNQTIEYYTEYVYRDRENNIQDSVKECLKEWLFIPSGTKVIEDINSINTFFKLKKCFMQKQNAYYLGSLKPYITDEYLVYPMWYFGKYKYH